MRLFEFDRPDLDPAYRVAVDRLKTDLDNGKLNFDMTTDQLLKYFYDQKIILDVTDLYNELLPTSKSPLKQVIANIKGDEVIFKGQPDGSDNPEQKTEQEKTVAKMAKKAMK